MINNLCYELYKVDWKHSHMITAEIEMDSIKNYYEDLVDCDMEYTYNDYLEEFGYDGKLYVCYEEFLENEYLDEDYICSLLDNEKLIAMYRKDINMKTMYERIKSMTKEEMGQFIYWVYMNGNRDGKTGYCDDLSAFFGSRGYLLNLPVCNIMPNNITDDLWDMFEENCRICKYI